MLRIITPVEGGLFLTIWVVASIPFRCGIPISMITMLGSSASARRTVSRPSALSPTTSSAVSRARTARILTHDTVIVGKQDSDGARGGDHIVVVIICCYLCGVTHVPLFISIRGLPFPLRALLLLRLRDWLRPELRMLYPCAPDRSLCH